MSLEGLWTHQEQGRPGITLAQAGRVHLRRPLWTQVAIFCPHCLPRGEEVFLTELRLKSDKLLSPCTYSQSTRTATRAGLS